MPSLAAHSEVKLKVGRAALLLGEFTIAQIVRATGLRPNSVRTEVQRLRRRGMITSRREPGRREALYSLADDPEKRLALSRSIEALYPEPPVPISRRPTSRLYQAALRTLDQAEREKGERRRELVEQAAHQLEGAWEAEGASRAPELVQAHLLREQGRLAYLQGRLELAKELFNRARESFLAAGFEDAVRLTEAYLLCIDARRRIDASGAVSAAERMRCVLQTLEAAEHLSVSPMVRLMAELTLTTEDLVRAAVYESVAELGDRLGDRLVDRVREKLHTEREQMPMLPVVLTHVDEKGWLSGPFPRPPSESLAIARSYTLYWRSQRRKPDA